MKNLKHFNGLANKSLKKPVQTSKDVCHHQAGTLRKKFKLQGLIFFPFLL